MEEIWKDIEGWEGLYQVSNLGRVKSLPRITQFGNRIKHTGELILSTPIGKRGYKVVVLYKNNKQYTFTLHRLIAKSFIPNPTNLPCIDHINTIRTDNRIDNLRWVSHRQNNNNELTKKHNKEAMVKAWSQGKFNARADNITFQCVAQYTLGGELVRQYSSIKEAGEATGICRASISCVCRGTNPNRHTAGGYIWRHIGKRCKKNLQ